jgi:hypothetical protein
MCNGRGLDGAVGPLDNSDYVQRERKRINDKLQKSEKRGGDYAEAYGEMSQLAFYAALKLAECDPSFGLTPVSDADVDAFDRALGEGRR